MEFLSISDISIAIVAIFLINRIYKTLNSPASRVPGPWYSTWTNLVCTYYELKGQKPAYVQTLHEQYGAVVRIGPDSFDVSDPAGSQRILSVKEGLPKTSWYRRAVPGVTTLFNATEPEIHRRLRRLLSYPLSESGLKQMYSQIDNHVKLAINRIREEAQTRGAADVFKWWLFMATDVIGELSFGKSFQMLEQGKKNQYIHDLERLGAFSTLAAEFPRLYTLSLRFPVPIMKECSAARQRLLLYADLSIARHEKLVEELQTTRPTLFTKMWKAEEEEELSAKEMRDSAQSYIVAGSDTTSNTLTYLTWSVCKHANVKERLVAELNSLQDDFTHDDVKELPYLNQVIDETLRLYPAAPAGLRRAIPAEGATIADVWFPGGVTVQTQSYSLHRNPIAFPDPERFDPSRWEKPTQAMKDCFIPFGGGARTCIGLHLARIELRLAAARFFRAFPQAVISQLEDFGNKDMEQILHFLAGIKGKRCLINVGL